MDRTATDTIDIVVIEDTLELGTPLKRCIWCRSWKPLDEMARDKTKRDGYGTKCKACLRENWRKKTQNGASSYQSTGYQGHRSKWGGARDTVIKEKITDRWHCQSCGSSEPEQLTPYLYEIAPREYIRVCALCMADGCQRYLRRLLGSDWD